MGKLTIGVCADDIKCSECLSWIRAGKFCVNWDDVYLCSQRCVDDYVEKNVGKDFIAAQDQALAKVAEIMDNRPRNFILIYEETEEEIGTVVMAHPQFALAALPILMEVSQEQGTVEPPGSS